MDVDNLGFKGNTTTEIRLFTRFKMSDQAGLTIDEILEQVGSCGFYQIRFVLLLSYIAISIIFPIAELTFLTAEPPWKCSANSTVCNMTGLFSPGDDYYKKRCSMDRSEWEFSDPFTSPITEVHNTLLYVIVKTMKLRRGQGLFE